MRFIFSGIVCFFVFGNIATFGAAYDRLTPELMRELETHLDKTYYSKITDADRALAFQLLQQFQARGKISEHPQLILSAGAMTAGKTTTFSEFEKEGLIKRDEVILIDPDEMKALIPGYQKALQSDSANAGTNFHLLSMFMGDILLGWNLLQNKSSIYMTSLRYMPAARELIERVRRDHPKFEVTIVYIRSPVATLMDRNLKREKIIKRLVPEDLLKRSVPEVEDSVWSLEPSVDRFILVVNDEDRPLQVSYLRRQSGVASTGINFARFDLATRSKLEGFLLGRSVDPQRLSLELRSPRDFLKDIDWSSFYIVPDSSLPDTFHYRGKYYRPTDGLRESAMVLLSIPGMRLSFISGGERDRNEEVLRAVKLPDGANLFERAYKILNTREFKRFSADEALRFSDQFKKDLTRVVSDIDLSQTLLGDDQPDATLPGEQAKSLLWFHRTFRFIDDYSKFSLESVAHLPAKERAYYPDSRDAWALERNKLAWEVGVTLVAVYLSDLTGLSLRHIAYFLTHDTEGRPINREDPSQFAFYLIGTDEMNKVNPHWQKVPLPAEVLGCRGRIKSLGLNFAKP